VVLTPHAAGSVVDDIALMANHAFANITRFLAGGGIPAADLVVDPQAPPWRDMRLPEAGQ
jgi:D-3-phosphoglycerate dehydrogenase